jgi:hypothetical protein
MSTTEVGLTSITVRACRATTWKFSSSHHRAFTWRNATPFPNHLGLPGRFIPEFRTDYPIGPGVSADGKHLYYHILQSPGHSGIYVLSRQ